MDQAEERVRSILPVNLKSKDGNGRTGIVMSMMVNEDDVRDEA